MPDRLIVAEIPLEGLADDGDVHADLAIERQLDGAGFDFEKIGSVLVVNEKPGEDEDPTGYVVTKIDVDDRELFACTCPAYKYQLPSRDQLRDGVVGIEGIGDCKHVKAVKRKHRSHGEVDESQSTLADRLGIDADDGGDA